MPCLAMSSRSRGPRAKPRLSCAVVLGHSFGERGAPDQLD